MKYLTECAVVSSMSEEEDDLEILRKAALQTLLKKTLHRPPSTKCVSSNLKVRGRGGFHRNGQYNNGRKHTNLIAIPTISNDTPQGDKLFKDVMSKLISSSSSSMEKNNTKFSRYDDKSDESDSEHSDDEKGATNGTLKKSDSLEALMLELENEISGDKKPKEEKLSLAKPRAEPVLPKFSISSSLTDGDFEIDDDALLLLDSTQEDIEEEFKETIKECHTDFYCPIEIGENSISPTNVCFDDSGEECETVEVEPVKKDTPQVSPQPRKATTFKSRSDTSLLSKGPPYRKIMSPPSTASRMNYSKSLSERLEYPNSSTYQHATSYAAAVSSYGFPPSSHNAPRPLSPLRLDAEALSTIAMAPLSPRSAAFVLQNREIIEKRKRSPRRYSRSPTSPRIRRSKSPPARRQRSPTPPRRQRLSVSPKRQSPRHVVKSSPVKRVLSPTDARRWTQRTDQKREPNATENVPKKRVSDSERPCTKIRTSVDSVLEARRKKFEQPSIHKEGLIRLKSSLGDMNHEEGVETPPPPVAERVNENSKEEAVDYDDMIDTHIDDIFFDEESDKEDENEGRFKSLTRAPNTTRIVPFTQLANKPGADISCKPLIEDCKPRGRVRHRPRHESRKDRNRRKRLSPAGVSVTAEKRRREQAKEVLPCKVDNTTADTNRDKHSSSEKKAPVVNEKTCKDDKRSKTKQATARRVAIAKDCKEVSLKKKEAEGVIFMVADDDDEKDVEKKTEAGDLRVQLSRKRAERQHHQKPAVKHEAVQSRLLHNALDAVLSKAVTRKKTEKTGHKERISIHLRLGVDKGSNLSSTKGKRTTDQV